MENTCKRTENCMQSEPAFCMSACPFHFDIKDFIGKMQRGSFNTAYRAYANAVGFPAIVAALCSEPCRDVCIRKHVDDSISLRLLEKASLDFARSTNPENYNIPVKHKKVAVIGAGISGLACALRLASKRYDVTVYEKSGRIGGHLHDLADPEVFMPDIERQFMHETYTLLLHHEVTDLASLDADAVYVATGKNGNTFGLTKSKEGDCASSKEGIFLGGSLFTSSTMEALAQGLRVPTAIERFIKAGRMDQPYEHRMTRLQMDHKRILKADRIIPQHGEYFTKEEAVSEANRCLKCSCDACMRHCDLMSYFKKYPRRIAEEVEITIHPGTLDGNGTVATRLISTCNQCGLCKEVCPVDIDVGDMLLVNHRVMTEKGAMPWAFHDFYLRDMEYSTTETYLSRIPKDGGTVRYLFFPGCQLGGSDPQYVTQTYRFLLSNVPDTAIMLSCCGAPAEWAGEETLRSSAQELFMADWNKWGQPQVIFACTTCRQMFERHHPEVRGIFLYEFLHELGITPATDLRGMKASVFDPCTSRHHDSLQNAIRGLGLATGADLVALGTEKDLAACCSFGGQVSIAHPPYSRFVVKNRISQNEYPYICYCSNCRDIFAAAKKPAWHILDLLFGLHDEHRIPPTLSQRRQNRLLTKIKIAEEFFNERFEMEKKNLKLLIADTMKEKLHKTYILEKDVERVILQCEQSGKKIMNTQTGTCIGHLQIGKMTFWAEYRKISDAEYELVNAYAHRMSIEEK